MAGRSPEKKSRAFSRGQSRTGKRDSDNTDRFIQDLRQRVIGAPEISTDGFRPYTNAIRDAFGGAASHGTITKTLSVTHLTKEAAGRYSPAAVVAVAREAVSGVPAEISTSYVERGNLSVRMGCRRFTRLTNGFSKRLENHCAAVSLYVAHHNLCRVHESLRSTPAMALGITERVWTVGDLLDAAIATQPIEPKTTAPDRRKRVPGNRRRQKLGPPARRLEVFTNARRLEILPYNVWGRARCKGVVPRVNINSD
jgi:IS1 family transposase